MRKHPQRPPARIAAAATAAALGAVIAPVVGAQAAPQSPWSIGHTRTHDWGSGREFQVRQWRNADYPGWVYIEGHVSASTSTLTPNRDGSVSTIVGQTPTVSCEAFGSARQWGTTSGLTASVGTWVKQGTPVSCIGDLGTGEQGGNITLDIPRK